MSSTITTLLQELMADYDSSIDTTEGSAFYLKVITPLTARLGADPLDADLEELVAAHVGENVEGADVGPLSGLRDLMVRPMVIGLEPWNRELQGVKVASSLDNYESMTRDEVDALLANFFISLNSGQKAQVTVRMYFSSPQTVVVTPLRQFSTGSGLNFFPTTTQTITSTSMTFNVENSLYYFDVTCEAEAAGLDYNVDAGAINTVSGVSGVVRVTNKAKPTTQGTADETKLEGITRARESITSRTLAVLRGCKTVLQEEFVSIDDIEVVGAGDELMLRDVVYGPVAISGIPGGYRGFNPADVGAGNSIHIGGKTDVWLFTVTPVEETLDISNIEDKGSRVFAGLHGYTEPGAAGSEWNDLYGVYSKRGIVAGDYLRYGESEYEILSVDSDTQITISGTIPAALSEQFYEIVRYEAPDIYADSGDAGFWYEVPLHGLIAVDSSGNVVTDDDGDVVLATPGDPANGAWTDSSGDYVKVEDNIADSNLKIPLVRIKSVVFLDPLDSLVETGDTIPLADVLLTVAQGDFTGGAAGTKAEGTLRLYFKDAVNVFLTPNDWRGTAVVDEVYATFLPKVPVDLSATTVELTGTGANDTELTVVGLDTSETLTAGDRIYTNGNWWTILEDGTFSAGDTVYTSIRENFDGSSSIPNNAAAPGMLEADMQTDSTGMYYFDVAAEAASVGVSGNIADGTKVPNTSGQGEYVEGYTVSNAESELSYSTKELVTIKFSRFLNDTKDLATESTAYAARIYYDQVEGYGDIQAFVEDEQNRPVGEDILVRHMLPSYFFTSMTTDLEAEAAQEEVIDYLLALDPTVDLELSDVVDTLYEAGASSIAMPISGVVLDCGRDRTWSAEIVTDTHTTSRINHYLADTDSITMSVR